MRTNVWAMMLAVSCALGSSSARADETVAECASAYVQAQVLQKDGKYLDAAQSALSCSKRTCGDSLSGECAKLYDVIQNATPSVVFAPRDGDQNDLLNVRVQVDGKVVLEKIDGAPVSLDPGVHVIRFESPGLPVVEKPYTLRAGEKMRLISELLGRKHQVPRESLDAHAPPPPPPSPSVSPRTLRISGGVLAGVGALALGGFGLLWWSGKNDYDSLLASCSPHCTDAQTEGGREKGTLSYVSLGVGIAALTASAALFAVSAGKHDTAAVQFVPRTSGGEARVVMRF